MIQQKKNRIFYGAAAVLVFCMLFLAATDARAESGLQPVIFLSPGSVESENIVVDDIFDIRELSPLAYALIVAVGENAGTLTITLENKSTSDDFLFEIDFMMIGASYALNGTPATIIGSGGYNVKITKKIPINSSFGIAAIGVLVNSVENEGNFVFPAKFTLTAELSVAQKD